MTKTICSYCGVGCGFEVEGKVKGDKTHPSNEGLICKKGSLEDKVVNNRILKPLFRENKEDEFREISYEEAIKIVANKIKNTSPQKIGFYLSGQLLNEDYYIANKLAKGFIKTNNVDTNSRTCMASAVVGYKKVIGSDYVPLTMEDALNCDLYILAGSNIAEAHIVFFNRVKKAKKKGLKVVVIDPRFTKTAEIADLYIDINVGGDIYLFLAMQRKFLDDGMIDFEFLRKKAEFSEDFFENLRQIDIDEYLKKAGVSKDKFEKLIELWKSNQNIVGSWTMGLNQSSEGVEKNIAFINLFLLTGKMFKNLNGPLSLTGQPNAMGGREVGGLATTLAVHLDYTPENVKKVEEFWGTTAIPTKIGLTADEMVKKGNLECLIVAHTDPVYHLPNRHETEKAFRDIDLVVELNAYKGSETSKFANLIIPVAPWGEKEGTQTNLDRVITLQKPFREKQAKQDWEVFADIGKALGFSGFDFSSSKEVFNEYKEMTRLSPDMNIYECDYDELENKPFRWGKNLDSAIGGKAKLIWIDKQNRSLIPDSEYPFLLITTRLANHWHSMTKTAQVIKDEVDFVEMNEEDMKSLGIDEGDVIEIVSKFSIISLKAKKSKIKKGVVAIPMHLKGINYLTNNILDPISKEPDYNHTPVRINIL
ncbi:nitrate reductase [Caminibacter mediatlanticus TB-2]|uniref:Nitrate reductase n=1 Tax=Caminibacter mediatlanticus TB-2 TaxID=391592 RepID=A0ABX5VAN1_9BACT|nr:molybdopterin oxidoreductase family protein [Caminibacter mediatlanticus]QCT94634.1 nitrate reductase [Caminibacter mediatlanticus TB-2]